MCRGACDRDFRSAASVSRAGWRPAGLAIAAWLLPAICCSASWPQFRGPNGSGIASGESVPVEFGPGRNELWSLPLESGHSSPCLAGDVLYLTTYDPGRRELAVVCVDLGENTYATPAVADGTLYVRTQGRLYAFRAARE
jgi:hypothetical protein